MESGYLKERRKKDSDTENASRSSVAWVSAYSSEDSNIVNHREVSVEVSRHDAICLDQQYQGTINLMRKAR